MVVDKTTTTRREFSVELEASLPPAEAEIGALTKADQLLTDIQTDKHLLFIEGPSPLKMDSPRVSFSTNYT